MLKSANRIFAAHIDQNQVIKDQLLQKNQCFVLITCKEPSEDGQMEVEMTYGGDPILAAYLVESASNLIDGET
jgi:hypothetical protein